MNLFHDVAIGKRAPMEVDVVIENCKGSSNKIEYDIKSGVFRLDRVLYSAVYWPFDYGFIPRTWFRDEDALDVVVLTTHPTFPGCVMTVRPIGTLRMEDEKGIDDKIIAVPVRDPTFKYDHVADISGIPPHTLKQIREFFETYKHLEPGKWVKFKKWQSVKEARKLIERAMRLYEEKFGKG